jgi:pimeloyl-ACP methyl ester carboxylesterase
VIEPFYFGDEGAGLFGVLHRPWGAAIPRDAGVVVVAPIGLENVCAYRPLRELAIQLAATGRPTLRFDLPGVGDSAGDETDEGLVESWVRSIGLAVQELRTRTGVTTVSVVGVRLAASLAALTAARDGGIDELVLWAPLQSGRAYVRETRAFHAIAQREFLRPKVTPEPLPEGTVEASGFLLAPSTVHDLGSVDLASLEFEAGPPRRVLLGERVEPPRGADDPLVARLRDEGCEVESVVLPDLDEVVAKSLDQVVPQAAFDAIAAWLRTGDPSPGSEGPHAGVGELRLDVEGEQVVERPLRLEPDRELFAIATTPADLERGSTWVVFVNTGGARRIGPDRMWTRFARRWAARGIPSLRLDVRGAGDSAGPFSASLTTMYDPVVVENAAAALSHLREQHGARRFVMIGLCSGGYTALHAAERHQDVAGVALVNAQTLLWTPADHEQRDRYVRHSPLNRGRWLRLLTGTVSFATAVRAAGHTAAVSANWVAANTRSRLGSARPLDSVARVLELVETPLAHGARLLFVFSKGSDGLDYLEWKLGPKLSGLRTRDGVRFEIVTGPDHTFQPLWSQDVLLGLLEEHLTACDVALEPLRGRA